MYNVEYLNEVLNHFEDHDFVKILVGTEKVFVGMPVYDVICSCKICDAYEIVEEYCREHKCAIEMIDDWHFTRKNGIEVVLDFRSIDDDKLKEE